MQNTIRNGMSVQYESDNEPSEGSDSTIRLSLLSVGTFLSHSIVLN